MTDVTIRKLVGLMSASLLWMVTACGATAPASEPTSDSTGGRVVLDLDSDGVASEDDPPVGAAEIVRLVDDPAVGLRILPQTPRTATDANGRFALPLGQVVPSNPPGVQVGLTVPLANGQGEGVWHVRSNLELERTDNVVLIQQLPMPCVDGTVDLGDLAASACPTLLLPDLEPIVEWDQVDPALRPVATESSGILPPETWFVDETDGGRRLLRFASLTANVGDGVLDVIAEAGDADGQRSWQRIWGSDLQYWDRRAGEFVYHTGHAHMHFGAFEGYWLLDDEGDVVAASEKVSFCLRDSIQVRSETRTSGVFLTEPDSCGVRQQAINPGYGDHYDQFLPDQWIDITGVPAGNYTVEIRVDPDNLILEADETNNIGRFEVTILDPES